MGHSRAGSSWARTLGDDAGATLPQGPVAGQKRLRQGLRRLVPDVVVRGRAPRQDVLHALPGVHQLLPHLQVQSCVVLWQRDMLPSPCCLHASGAKARDIKSAQERGLPGDVRGVHWPLLHLSSTKLSLPACKPLGPQLDVWKCELPDGVIHGTSFCSRSEEK